MSDTYIPIITHAGFQAAMDANAGGFSLDITHVAVGSSGYIVPTNASGKATQTALIGEQQRVAIQDARDVGNGQKDISFVVEGAGDYFIREVGFFLGDGTLFAIASHPTQGLIWKSSISRAAIALELIIEAVDPTSVNIVSVGPPLQLLMTNEIATLSTFAMKNGLENLRLADRVREISGDY